MSDSIRTLETLELVGGALCLDFVNTVNSRVHPEHDYFVEYSDVVGWAKKIGTLSPAQGNHLLKQATQDAGKAETALSAIRSLRDLLYRLFSKAAKQSQPAKRDMEIFTVFYGEAISHSQFLKKDHHYTTTWRVDERLNALLWPIIGSAGELLLSEDLTQVKECPGCGWLFLDTSKNQSRRWCCMNTCGSRDKMRRYHKRKQKRG
jgi:predicted RNA-binding Zn ribbon-like protein